MALLMKRPLTRAPLGRFVAIELVDIGHRGHAELGKLRLRHFSERPIKGARPNEERGVQQRSIDLALEHAGIHEIEKALDEHFARAVEANIEATVFTHRRRRDVRVIEAPNDAAKIRVVAMAQNERLGDRIAQRSDAELQRSAVRNRARDVQASGVFGETDGFAWRCE